MASRWADHLQVNPAYYPGYNVLYGSLKWIVSDPFAVTILHRVLIVFGTTLLLLAVFRRLLTPGIAWVLTAWWAILPITYDTIFEIHLLGALVGLVVVLVALRWSGLAARAATFGLLLAAALLIRNEYVVGAFVFGVIWAGYELRRVRRGTAPSWRQLASAVAVPLLGFAVLVALVSWRDADPRTSAYKQLSDKNGLAFCQGYALGLDHAGDVRASNPLSQCQVYTRADFGQDRPSIVQAIGENPSAVAGHFGRNLRLFPAALEIGLFNAKAGSVGPAANPDYIDVNQGSWLDLAGLLVVGLTIVTGAALIWSQRRRWWEEWLRDRAWGWAALFSIGSVAVYAGLMTRPRPSYIFPLTILVLALLGMSLVAIADRIGLPRNLRAVIPPLAILAVVLIPSHYRAGYSNPQTGPGQPLKMATDRLLPYRSDLEGDQRVLLAVYPSTDACPYVGGSDQCTSVPWNYPIGKTLAPELAGRQQHVFDPMPVNLIYANESAFSADPTIRSKLEALMRHGWHRVAPSTGSDWLLLARDRSPAAD
jgi:hypothetical protein